MTFDTPTPPADATATPVKPRRPFYRKPIGCFALFVLGILGCVVVLNWSVGRLMPIFANVYIQSRVGGMFKVDDNRSSFLGGKIEFCNAWIVNPPEFRERIFLKINRAKVSFSPFRLLVGQWDFSEIILDVEELTLVGKTPKHSNLSAFHDALSDSKKKRRDATAGKSKPRKNFHIGKLILKLDHFRIVAETGMVNTKVLLNTSGTIPTEIITDITQDNFKAKVLDRIERHLNARYRTAAIAQLPSALGAEASQLLDTAATTAGDTLIHAGETATNILDGFLNQLAAPGKPAP